MLENSQIKDLFSTWFEKELLIQAVLSAPRQVGESTKVVIRPLVMKGKTVYQLTEQRQQQALHRNLSPEECCEWLNQHSKNFKQSFFYTKEADYHLLVSKKGQLTLLKKPPTKVKMPIVSTHNRQKEYLLSEGTIVPFLVQLGIMSSTGKVHANKRDKFRQINRFLEMIDDVLVHLDPTQLVRLIDFGCGKAYLTFALYHFLKIVKGYQVQITGLDLKQEVIQYCQELAETLGYQHDLQFIQGDINDFQAAEKVDMMVSLHACDTATDAALEKAVRWQTRVILCVPCCQHELMHQVQNQALEPLLKQGILKERFAALATDAARAQLLEVLGYQTQILEFIDLEHTPKNLLIRAVKRKQASIEHSRQAWKSYLTFKENLGIHPSLEKRFQAELKQFI